ncbi:undecaprenyl-diphosphate phosphatase [Rheinheimera baltica]|uniref:Undecaprenyl-diphosphatase n=1 Tax=Rheinheimera baltica TaxID=67576 RepID=A0ABT9I5U5_9GAMM|nr:undecaprenyl-diphosphate phosphatase [Rheinheimera baltica]MDP5138762.1 undecaprenyl-diphosphate phosphatase [Rheinheimera baltica]MDP5142170.1 undecaprenyl-diphosphate phosphatase [Rheinheimera baltica]MDP5150464.1 undecaprenyl-diphosphate phosphatase [Rheinheimera baltica]MDP5190696.1 undecaprenyl-diphosphate phosphatase [Rheinheimera baltica]
MSTVEVIILAIIQGLTEFLPISSSAHLILPSAVFGWQDQGIVFDVAVHVGTLLAVMLYFRHDIGQLTLGWVHSLSGKHSMESKLAWWVILATIPAGLAGLLAAKADVVDTLLRSPWIIAFTTIVFGFALWWADATAKQQQSMDTLSWKQALFIGVAQALSIVPGTSRSGITMTAAMLIGLDKVSAARFSFLLSIPIIVLSGGYQASKLLSEPERFDVTGIALGMGLSFICALVCIHFFLKIISRMGMFPFVVYRLLLGVGLIIFLGWFAG